jgi:hypothetical protein
MLDVLSPSSIFDDPQNEDVLPQPAVENLSIQFEITDTNDESSRVSTLYRYILYKKFTECPINIKFSM